jgi:hypothetical protein
MVDLPTQETPAKKIESKRRPMRWIKRVYPEQNVPKNVKELKELLMRSIAAERWL